MVMLIIALALGLLGVCTLGLAKTEDGEGFGAFLVVFSVLLLILGVLLPTGIGYGHQVSDKNAIIQYRQNAVIYQHKADAITGQLKGYLAVEYPNLEKQIFKTISKSPNLLFVIYPQLQSSKTLVALASRVEALQSQVWDQKIKISQSEKNLRTRRGSPWLLTFLLP